MAEKAVSEPEESVDHLSQLQQRLDDLGVKFYTYLGIIQRDAPPVARGPEEAEEVHGDEVMRQQLLAKTPEFARDVVSCSREIDRLIEKVDEKMKSFSGKERDILQTANLDSAQAGEEMTEAVDDAQKLLASIRDITAVRETES